MGRVKGNKSGRFLKARLVGKSKTYFNELKQTSSLVLLSVRGNKYCLGEYLKETLSSNIQEFGKTTVLIADEVYWHNLKPNKDVSPEKQETLKAEANKIGEQFFNKNLKAFCDVFKVNLIATKAKLKNCTYDEKVSFFNKRARETHLNIEICRWSDWINYQGNDASELLDTIKDYYNQSNILNDSVEKTAVEFAKRHKNEGDIDLWMARSKGYLEEESLAVMYLAAKRGFNFIAYPGKYFLPFKATKDFFVGNNALIDIKDFAIDCDPNKCCNWLEVDFVRHVGYTVSNIDPIGPDIAKEHLLQAHGHDPIVWAKAVTTQILSDDRIDANLRLSVLISALAEINNQLEEKNVFSENNVTSSNITPYIP